MRIEASSFGLFDRAVEGLYQLLIEIGARTL
jgi:hypothetical protein